MYISEYIPNLDFDDLNPKFTYKVKITTFKTEIHFLLNISSTTYSNLQIKPINLIKPSKGLKLGVIYLFSEFQNKVCNFKLTLHPFQSYSKR
jgi:hypothetical protein